MKKSSSQFGWVLAAVVALLPLVGGASASVVSASGGVHAQSLPTPAIHYTFDTDLLDSQSGSTLTVAAACPADPCNSASSFGSDSEGKYWTWTSTANRGGGFTVLANSDIGTSYTVALKFSFSAVTSWRKIIDYENRVSDNGFYYYGSKLQFYNGGSTFNSTTTYPANTVLDLVIVRSATGATSGVFTVFGVGSDNSLTQLFQYTDNVGNSIPHKTAGGQTKLGFFFDDTATSMEATPSGKVYDLRIWGGSALTTQTLTEAATRPGAVTNIVTVPQPQSIDVSWSAVQGATSYIATAGANSCTSTAPTTSCTITGLTNGTSVSVQVQAIGPGGWSAVASTAAVVVGPTTTTTAAPATTAAPTTTAAPATTAAAATTVPSVTTVAPALAASNQSGGVTNVALGTKALPSTGRSSRAPYVGVLMLSVGLVLVRTRRRTRHL